MNLTNTAGERIIEVVDEGDGGAKILFYKPEKMTMVVWQKHIVEFQKFMNELKIKARRRNQMESYKHSAEDING